MQVIFAVSDAQRAAAFYEGVFGWPRNTRIDYSNYVELHVDRGGTLGLYERTGFAGEVGAHPADVPPADVAPAYIYVRVDDVEATAARLEEAGGQPLSPLADRSWGERAAWFADPDRNLIAVAQAAAVVA